MPSTTADRLVPFSESANLVLDVVDHELSGTRSFDGDCPHMTSQRSEIFRAFARGESVTLIAESRGVSNTQAWSQLRRAVVELDRKNPSAIDAVRWQQYLVLMRIVDQAFAAFEKSAEEGVREVTCQTIESAHGGGKLRLTGKSVTHRVRKGAGDVRFLEMALEALAEIRDLFKIGAEAERILRVARPKEALLSTRLGRKGWTGHTTQRSEPLDAARDLSTPRFLE